MKNNLVIVLQIVICAIIVAAITWLLWPIFKFVGAIINGIIMTVLLFWGWTLLWKKISPWIEKKLN